jgi:hypothetical protein
MAQFTGNIKDFERFIGPRLRNIVQTSIAKSYKIEVGKCQTVGCESKHSLEAAHVHGSDRQTLMRKAYKKYIKGNQLVNLDLVKFEDEFVGLHKKRDKVFKILCSDCHRKYDRGTPLIKLSRKSRTEKLPVSFYPENIDEFRLLLIQYKGATVKITYKNGKTINKLWRVAKLNGNSDIKNNLLSRTELRNPHQANIRRVDVSINYRD